MPSLNFTEVSSSEVYTAIVFQQAPDSRLGDLLYTLGEIPMLPPYKECIPVHIVHTTILGSLLPKAQHSCAQPKGSVLTPRG